MLRKHTFAHSMSDRANERAWKRKHVGCHLFMAPPKSIYGKVCDVSVCVCAFGIVCFSKRSSSSSGSGNLFFSLAALLPNKNFALSFSTFLICVCFANDFELKTSRNKASYTVSKRFSNSLASHLWTERKKLGTSSATTKTWHTHHLVMFSMIN